MKISPISFCESIPKKYFINNKKQHVAIPVEYSYAYYSPCFKGSSEFKPISLNKANYGLLNCDYYNLDEFSYLFSQKLNSQMMVTKLEDVKALINRIKIKTGADENTINKVLYQLTLFSNYGAIKVFQNIMDKTFSSSFGIQTRWKGVNKDISSNTVLNYFTKNKEFIKCKNNSENTIIVLDDIFINQLKESKQQGSESYKKFIEDLRHNSATILNLKGWDIECSDKKRRSAAFIYGTGNLEYLAIDVIKRIQQGENINDILYSDFEQKLLDIIGDDVPSEKIKVHKITAQDKIYITAQDIYNNIKIPELTPEKVKENIEKFSRNREENIPILAKYLDEASVAYSFDTINSELIKMYNEITKKYGDNIAYLILDYEKSGSIISHLFAYINNIPLDKFHNFDRDPEYFKKVTEDNTATFVLDDISASGKSVDRNLRKTKFMQNLIKSSFNYGLLTASKTAKNVFDMCDYKMGELLSLKDIIDVKTYEENLLNFEEFSTLNSLIYSGYYDVGLSVVYPYIIPDNCSSIAAELLDELLIESNPKSNKAKLFTEVYA